MESCSRHSRLIFTLPVMLSLSTAGLGRGPAETSVRQCNKLLDRGLFADAVAACSRAIEGNPKEAKAYYYRALANEMVERQAAIRDWRRFIELKGTDSDSKEVVNQVQERVQALESRPALPDTLQPWRYVPKAGDYYLEVARDSAGLLWTGFPVKVFADSPPEEWRRALQEALAAWKSVFPLQPASTWQDADIVISWGRLPEGKMGTEHGWTTIRREDDRVVERRKRSLISLDNSRRWSQREMRAALLHEVGHALGIGGHSDGARDVMFPAERNLSEVSRGGVSGAQPVAGGSAGIFTRVRLNTKLTSRDVNTLIRLYNCPGPLVLLR
jgi:predicted Zn-dependent protease